MNAPQIADGGSTCRVGADVVAEYLVVVAEHVDTVGGVAANHVSVYRRSAADYIGGAFDIHTIGSVGLGRAGASAIGEECADVVAGQRVTVSSNVDENPAACKVTDHKAAYRAAAAASAYPQAVGVDVIAVQHDGRPVAVGGKAIVGAGIQDHRIGDRGQRARGVDGVHTCAGDVEVDSVGASDAIGRVVGRRDSLAQADETVGAHVGQQRIE